MGELRFCFAGLSNMHRCCTFPFTFTGLFLFNISSTFVQAFVPFVNKLLNARCKEQFWLLSPPLTNDWLHLCILCKFLPTYHFVTSNVYCSHCKTLVAVYWMHFRVNLICILKVFLPTKQTKLHSVQHGTISVAMLAYLMFINDVMVASS